MTTELWFAIAGACFAIAVQLLLLGWRRRHHDPTWARLARWLSRLRAVLRRTPRCATCVKGVADISGTTVTGSWTCPACGLPHCFVDGRPGSIDP